MQIDLKRIGLSYNVTEVNKKIRDLIIESFDEQNKILMNSINLEEETIFLDNRNKNKSEKYIPHYLFGVIINHYGSMCFKEVKSSSTMDRDMLNIFYHDIGCYLYLATKSKHELTYHFRKAKPDSIKVNLRHMTIKVSVKHSTLTLTRSYSKMSDDRTFTYLLSKEELSYILSNVNKV